MSPRRSDGDVMRALIQANHLAGKRYYGEGNTFGVLRMAATHTGAALLSALRELGWELTPTAGPTDKEKQDG